VFGNDADFVMTEINGMMGGKGVDVKEAVARNVYDPHQFPRRPFLLDLHGATSTSTPLRRVV